MEDDFNPSSIVREGRGLEYAFIEQDGDDEQQEDSFVSIVTTKPLSSGPTISTEPVGQETNEPVSNDSNDEEKEASTPNAEQAEEEKTTAPNTEEMTLPKGENSKTNGHEAADEEAEQHQSENNNATASKDPPESKPDA
mmetsp:Transcript_5430/g.15970  ORF Transcript_5430/g.15970 Transcript_5430/m.15970 type:complete len:139 (-) Transcript_5430:90-506(-)